MTFCEFAYRKFKNFVFKISEEISLKIVGTPRFFNNVSSIMNRVVEKIP